MSTKFEISRAESAGVPILRLKGKLTLGEGSRALRASISEIVREGHKYVMLDLREVTYVDSSGLGALVAAYNLMNLQGGAVGLFQVPVLVRELLEMSGLTAVFRIFSTEREAAAAG